MNYKKLVKSLKDFEGLLAKSKLTTDELADLIDRVGWLHEELSNKESDD
jgi:hypothetical protein